MGGGPLSTVVRYALIQIPSALLLAAILLLLRHWWGFPSWVVWSLLALWLLKDAALYPLVRRAYEPADAGTAGSLLKRRGIAREPLNPVGYVEIRGELWRAEVADGGSVEQGASVQVREVHGLTLVVEPSTDESPEAGSIPSGQTAAPPSSGSSALPPAAARPGKDVRDGRHSDCTAPRSGA